MRRFTTWLLAYLLVLTASARELSADQALQRAVATISNAGSGTRGNSAASYTLAHTKKSVSNGATLYYVFSNDASGGFMIASADTRANAVLGQTDNGSYEQALTVPGFRAWLNSCQEAMQQLSITAETQLVSAMPGVDIPEQVITSADGTQKLTIAGQCNTPDPTLPSSVEPLLGSIAWNQHMPYNALCPNQINADELCVTGCVATAMAQVMKYYEWPKQGTGSECYTPAGFDYELSSDFSKSTYDWDNMLDDYHADYTNAQALAVAQLMKDVGISVKMDYGSQSATSHHNALKALSSYFGYNKGMLMGSRVNYNYTEWNNLLKNELAAQRPLIYCGTDQDSYTAHEFVIDGYNEVGNYHVNWGWGGMSNGYYDINFLYPDNQGTGGSNGVYASEQLTILNCFPDLDGTSTPQYQLAIADEIDLKDDRITCRILNNGMAIYTGQVGYVVVVDNKIVNTYKFTDIEPEANFTLRQKVSMEVALETLGITPELLVNHKCRIYPYYSDTDGNKVPLSTAAFANYVTLCVDQEGKIVSETDETENANLSCEQFEIIRNYKGFNIKARALISNDKNGVTFDRPIFMFIYDENDELLAQGANFAFIDPAKTCELEFTCYVNKNKDMEAGKTYYANLGYYSHGKIHPIPDSNTTVTLKDAGGFPSLSYINFAIDKKVIAPDDIINVSFDINNSGGFSVDDYYIYVFKASGGKAQCKFEIKDIDLPVGTITVSKSCAMSLAEGTYYLVVYLKKYDWQIVSDRYYFTVSKDPDSLPYLSYANFAIDKTVIAPNEVITVSFDIDNAGSYGEREFGIFVFDLYADGGSLAGFRTNKVELNRGTTTVTKPCTIELSEGCYYFLVYILENGTWIKISNYLFFDVTDEATAISSVTGDTEVQDQYYDLQGHRVSSPTKGLYIKNGKKFVKHK